MDRQPRPGETAVRFGILGPLRISVDGRVVSLDSPTQRRLLGALLVEAGSVVPTDRLAEILWGDDRPANPSATIQTHVSRLRSALATCAGDAARELVLTRPPGYLLAAPPGSVDAHRFERLVHEARASPRPEAAVALLTGALDLWRGSPLLELDHERAAAEAARLQELRTTARELLADAKLRLGRHDEVVVELEGPVARHPHREHLRALQMVALYRCGRQADALASYRALRDELVSELGVEPSAPLRALELAVLQQADELPWPAPPVAVAGPGRPRRAAGAALPAEPLTSFVGRDRDVRGVVDALGAKRIVVVTGPGGVGKSRLALRVAGELVDGYADGVRVCDLSDVDGSHDVAGVVAGAVGVLPAERDDPADRLVEALRAQQLLLVLDNCEHVWEGASDVADRIARSCPDVDVLATSRRPLDVSGQQNWPLPPLDVGDAGDGPAVALFRDRARAADPTFVLTGAGLHAAVEICRRLDGLPLALELAAARIRSMGPADIADRLHQRFDLLRATAPEVPHRHRSVQAVVEWSYALLPERTQRLLDRLAVFAGGFSIDAVEQVCAGDGLPVDEIAGRVAALADHSLVVVERGPTDTRYRLLETLRAHGVARLEARDELGAWQRRHAEHFASLAAVAAAGVDGPEEAEWMRVVDTELANLRAALGWARADGPVDLALQLPARLAGYAYRRLHDEVHEWALEALELRDAARSPEWAAVNVAAGIGLMQRGRLQPAFAHGRRALAAASRASDRSSMLRAHQLLAEIALYRGDLEETAHRGAGLVEQARSAGSPHYEALGQLYRSFAAAYAGRSEEAAERLAQGWDAVRRADNPTLRAGYHHLEGEIRLDADPDVARASLERSIEIAASVRNRFIEGVARVSLASLEARYGEPGAALTAFREIVDHWRAAGDWAHMWTTLHNLVVLLERVGSLESATTLLGAIETASTGAPAFGADAERLAAVTSSLRAALGDGSFAAAHARGRVMSDDRAVAHALEEIARLLRARDVVGDR